MKTRLESEEIQNLRALSRRVLQSNLQALDIKQMAEFEHFYKRRCRLAISLYKGWLKEYRAETDSIHILYGSIEGMMLRRQAEEAVQLYWIIREDFRRAFKDYIKAAMNCNSYNQNQKKAA